MVTPIRVADENQSGHGALVDIFEPPPLCTVTATNLRVTTYIVWWFAFPPVTTKYSEEVRSFSQISPSASNGARELECRERVRRAGNDPPTYCCAALIAQRQHDNSATGRRPTSCE